MTQNPAHLLIGAHTSTAGGIHHALLEGKEIGATTIQLFTTNQRQWQPKAVSAEALYLWQQALAETGLQKIMSHDSYLINLGAPNPEILEKSRVAFRSEVERCLTLGVSFLNFHPGAALKEDRQLCLDRIVESVLEVESLVAGKDLRLLLETTAGQGSCVGCHFEELAYILSRLKTRIPIGVCIDTCHIFVAGYDIRTPAAWDATLNAFDRTIGLEHLYALHVNDSLKDCGSRVDRHTHLGEGKIGMEAFRFMMQDPRLSSLPKYLETPEGKTRWKDEIALLRNFANIDIQKIMS